MNVNAYRTTQDVINAFFYDEEILVQPTVEDEINVEEAVNKIKASYGYQANPKACVRVLEENGDTDAKVIAKLKAELGLF